MNVAKYIISVEDCKKYFNGKREITMKAYEDYLKEKQIDFDNFLTTFSMENMENIENME